MQSKRMKRSLALPLMVIVALGAVQVLPNSAEANVNPAPEVTVTLDPSCQDARVSESASGSVQFTGSVKVDKLPVCLIILDITSSIDAGWASQCSPSSMVMTDLSAHRFSVTVVVPAGTPSNVIGTLKVDAKGQGGDFLWYGSGQVIVTAKPYHDVKLETPEPYEEISPGGQAHFWLNACNTGYSVDSYDVEIVNLKELVARGWTVTLGGLIAKVPPGEGKRYPIIPQSPRDCTIWKDEAVTIIVKATSLNAKEEQSVVFDTFQFVVYQKVATPDPILVGSTLWISIFAAASAAWLAGTAERKRRMRRGRRTRGG